MNYDVIVLGTGGIGSAAFHHLAQRGLRVLGLDGFPRGHDRGSSHGQTRVIRQAYFEHPDYVPLAKAAYAGWANVESQTGRRLFYSTGLLQAGPANGQVISGVIAAAEAHDLNVDEMKPDIAALRFPQFTFRPDDTILFEALGGYLLVEACVRAHIEAAENAGGQWHQEAVQSWQADGDGVKVTTDQSTYQADRLVIAAGPWAERFLPQLGPLERRAKHLHWFHCFNPQYDAKSGCPVFLFEVEGGGIYYGFPTINGELKLAEHSGGTPLEGDVQDFSRAIDETDLQRVSKFAEQVLPQASAQHVRNDVCFYTMSRDEHFLVGTHPEHQQVVFAAGMSGHGFKFAPVLGEALADLATDGKTDLPIGFLNPNRFD